tara:strand:- start:716 stop:922 length:207 start_codon:yes stop_codon:yes gene_type:complete
MIKEITTAELQEGMTLKFSNAISGTKVFKVGKIQFDSEGGALFYIESLTKKTNFRLSAIATRKFQLVA